MKLSIEDIGQIKCTNSVKKSVKPKEIWGFLTQFLNGDFGDITATEKEINARAFNEKYGYIMGYYHSSKGTLCIALDYEKHETIVSFFGEIEY